MSTGHCPGDCQGRWPVSATCRPERRHVMWGESHSGCILNLSQENSIGRWQNANWKGLCRVDHWEKLSWRQGSQPEENTTCVSGETQFNVGSQESPQKNPWEEAALKTLQMISYNRTCQVRASYLSLFPPCTPSRVRNPGTNRRAGVWEESRGVRGGQGCERRAERYLNLSHLQQVLVWRGEQI